MAATAAPTILRLEHGGLWWLVGEVVTIEAIGPVLQEYCARRPVENGPRIPRRQKMLGPDKGTLIFTMRRETTALWWTGAEKVKRLRFWAMELGPSHQNTLGFVGEVSRHWQALTENPLTFLSINIDHPMVFEGPGWASESRYIEDPAAAKLRRIPKRKPERELPSRRKYRAVTKKSKHRLYSSFRIRSDKATYTSVLEQQKWMYFWRYRLCGAEMPEDDKAWLWGERPRPTYVKTGRYTRLSAAEAIRRHEERFEKEWAAMQAMDEDVMLLGFEAAQKLRII